MNSTATTTAVDCEKEILEKSQKLTGVYREKNGDLERLRCAISI